MTYTDKTGPIVFTPEYFSWSGDVYNEARLRGISINVQKNLQLGQKRRLEEAHNL